MASRLCKFLLQGFIEDLIAVVSRYIILAVVQSLDYGVGASSLLFDLEPIGLAMG